MDNEIITSPDDGGLIGAIHSDKNDVIIIYTMLRYLAPLQLLPIIDIQRIMYDCNTSKYFQELLNLWRRKQLKIMKDKADNICGREKG